MENKTKVILSTFGPLHLIKSAEFLSKFVDIVVIQGWIPQWWNKWLIGSASKIIGRDLSKSFKKRIPKELDGRNYSVAIPEFLLWTGLKMGIKDFTPLFAAKLYGFFSKIYIKNAQIFHVRSGSGFGGAIEKARHQNMKIIVDHSIAHPHFMRVQLEEEYVKHGKKFRMGDNNSYWNGIINDCKKADVILVNSQFVKETFINEGFPANKLEVILLGVRKDFFSLKNDYQIKSKIKFLFTGSYGFRKGSDYIQEALKILENEGLDYEMIIVGDNSEIPIEEKKKLSSFNFVGFVPQDELKSYLSSSDIYLFPSLCEGCASSAMEAMASGLPVIATKESGLPITNGVNGLIIPSKDSSALVLEIHRLLSDEKLRSFIGHNAAMTIAENYTWEQYSEKVYKLYQRLLGYE